MNDTEVNEIDESVLERYRALYSSLVSDCAEAAGLGPRALAPGLQPYHSDELRVVVGIKPLRFFDTEQAALAAIDGLREPRDLAQPYAAHPHGTCRMGPATGPHAGVVDGDGKVRGVEGLYAMDGSIFPSTLGVNPQVTIMSLALALARRLA